MGSDDLLIYVLLFNALFYSHGRRASSPDNVYLSPTPTVMLRAFKIHSLFILFVFKRTYYFFYLTANVNLYTLPVMFNNNRFTALYRINYLRIVI